MSYISNLTEELKIPRCYIKELDKPDRFLVIAHQSWLRKLIKIGSLNEFILHETLSANEVEAKLKLNESLGPSWSQVFISILPKSDKRVVPLPRQRTQLQSSEGDLTYSQILQYISLTNHKNLWKESFKKFNARFTPQPDGKESASCINLIQHDSAVRDIIIRTYSCPITRLNVSPTVSTNALSNEPHPNLLPACATLETNSFFYILQKISHCYTLQDCVNFSPAVLNDNNYKSMFLAYQLLRVMRDMHDKGLAVGDITLSDILISDNLWIQVIPKLSDNVYDPPKQTNDRVPKEHTASKRTPTSTNSVTDFPCKTIPDKENLDIGQYCDQWVQGALSNYDYLIVLNKLAGRKYGDPRSHYVFPWVSDFTSRSGLNWRDLTRSKYRLNKGDRQLDLTYDIPSMDDGVQVPHHVSDILSEITYYVYLCRITPKTVLCKYVRTQWVPAEYPVSIQRLQQWTPDECIPEFFTDASVFKSIHSDLPDLEIPPWANSAQDFVNCHRAALESTYVSERLHYWIDLTFGYKLSGSAAVKAKNVCLQLVDNHTTLTSSGIMQLFTYPHPQKFIPSPYLSKTPPRMFKPKAYIDEDDHSSGPEESESISHSSLGVSKFISRSRNSLNFTSPANSEGILLHLPQGYNPLQPLIAYENTYTFITRTCNKPKINLQSIRVETDKNLSTQYKQVVATRRAQEMLVFGCILVELFMPAKLRIVGSNLQVSCFKRRLENCRALLCSKREDIPKCIRSVVTLLLQTDNITGVQMSAGIRMYPVTEFGVPPPSAHQLLLSNLSSHLLPLPVSFAFLYASLKTFRDFARLEDELRRNTKPDANERAATVGAFGEVVSTISKCINEHKVTELAKSLHTLDEAEKGTVLMNPKWIDFTLPLVVSMLEDRKTDVSAAWHLLGPMTRILGPQQSVACLLQPTMKLYEYQKDECYYQNEEATYDEAKRVKLYHRTFLLRLIVGFGLKNFLEYIGTFLIEAVGGYQDVECYSKSQSNTNPVQRLTEITGFSPPFENGDVVAKSTSCQRPVGELPSTLSSTAQTLKMPDSADENTIESEEADSDTDNLTSLNEVLLDEREMVSDDDKHYVSESNEYEEIASCENHASETVGDCGQPVEKGINDQCKIAEVSAESVMWLAHRLGPTLTAKYLTRNLLRMLTLCYSGDLYAEEKSTHVVNCLINIADLYGEQFIIAQYIPHMADFIAVCKRSKMTQTLEGGLIGYISFFKYVITFLSTNTLKELMQESLSKSILHPAIRLMTSTKILFPSGFAARSFLASKLIDCLYMLGMRLGHLISRSLQRFFLAFDKLRVVSDENERLSDPSKSGKFSNTHTFEIDFDKSANSDSAESPNPPSPTLCHVQDKEQFKTKVMDELCNVLTPELAYEAYSVFARYFGESFMQRSLINLDFIQQLCALYKEERQLSGFFKSGISGNIKALEEYDGTQATVSGNKIHFPDPKTEAEDECKDAYNETRHLRGNWHAYWDHEIGCWTTNTKFNFKQIKLQSFVGHTNTVKSIQVLDNENSFMSGSRDKTVKLWSLRSQGDGSAVSECQYTYTNHHKSVLSLGFCERTRLVASCDSLVHLWDPFIGRLISVVRNGYPVNTLVPLAAPHATIIAANTHASLNVLDTRTATYVSELKVCVNATGLIRSVATAPSSNWVAVGQSSGTIAVLDLRTGNIMSSWKGHEGEILQLIAFNEHTLITSSLDQSISVWNVSDGKLNFNMKGPIEPVHCLALHEDELISGTTANRIGVHTDISNEASFSSTKLRSDSFKGVLTTAAVLPLNKLLLLGADTGCITLLC